MTCESKTQSVVYTEPLPNLSLGCTIGDFELVDIHPIEEISGYGYVFSHIPTKARALWLACDDVDKSFCIGFKTPPKDSTGVFHILEHSVLCGSKKFPVKEPFVNLLKSSMTTFLNAMTWPDKTIYPVATTSEAELDNLMDVYVDAVLHPNIYDNKFIFEQEGWHLELDENQENLTYNGVVYNEMKGVFSRPENTLSSLFEKTLFPDTAYGHVSGGHPLAIPDLTYENFLDSHKRHYQLSNSYSFFYGALDIHKHLFKLSGLFSNVEPTESKPNPLTVQKPVNSVVHETCVGNPENSCVGLGFVLPQKLSRTKTLALHIILDALLGNNEAPLKKKLLNLGIGQDIEVGFSEQTLQPLLAFELRGAKEDVAKTFEQTIVNTCARFVRNGIDRNLLESALASLEFSLRESDTSVSKGVIYAIQSLTSWLYDPSDPFSFIHYESALIELKEGLNTSFYEDLLREFVVENNHKTLIDLRCVEGSDKTPREIELQSKLPDLSTKDKQTIITNVTELRRVQETPDSPEALASLPRLQVTDIQKPANEPNQKTCSFELPCTYHEIDTHGIDYLYTYFGLNCLHFDDLPYVKILTRLLGKLETEHFSAQEIALETQKYLGNSSFFNETYTDFNDDNVIKLNLVCAQACLKSNVSHMARLLSEIVLTTKFDDTERVYNILCQDKLALEEGFMGSGHACAMKRLASYYTHAGVVSEKLSGIEYYRFLCDMIENFEMRSQSLTGILSTLQKKIFVRQNVELSFTGAYEDLEIFFDHAQFLNLPKARMFEDNTLDIPKPTVKNEAFGMPGQVCYNAQATILPSKHRDLTGAWVVASRALTFDYLWNEVRVQGGAYGCGFKSADNALLNWSYRDPQVDATFKRFRNCAAWLKNWDVSQSEIDGYILSSVAELDAPRPAREVARRQDLLRLSNTPQERPNEVRNQILAITPQEIEKLIPIIADEQNKQARCIFGSKDMIERSHEDLRVLELIDSK